MKYLYYILLIFATSLIADNAKIQHLTFNPDEIFTLKGTSGFLTIIQFSKDEKVLNAGSGFNDGWDINTFQNFVSVKPIGYKVGNEEIEPNPKDWRTNIFIQTSKRTYDGILEIAENGDNQYRISFKYPQDEAERKRQKAAAEKRRKEAERKRQKEEAERKRIADELAKKTVPRNWNYMLKKNDNSDDITPDYVYDDGTFTYFGFNKTKSFPAIFEKEEEGESLLNTHTEKNNDYNVLVVHQLIKLIYLRKGDKLVAILNKGYGVNPNYEYSDTINKNIKREIIK